MRILTWNIQHGGGARASLVAERIIDANPDIAVITEFRNNQAGKAIKTELAAAGMVHSISTNAESRQNTVLIASTYKFKPIAIPHLEPISQRVICVDFQEFVLFGFYFPGKAKKIPIFQAICDLNSEYPMGKSLLIGDFNTGKHYLDESGATFVASEYIDKLEGIGWLDSWRSRNNQAREFSWFSNKGNGFRIDHAFASPLLDQKISNAKYLHQPRIEGVSDHSMLLLETK